MSKRDLALRVGGAAGDGVSSTAESFAKISARSGLHTWTYSSYQSVIRGGHVWTQVRGGLDPLLSPGDDPDVVLCLNQQTMDVHQADVPEDGAIIFDVDSVKPDLTKIRENVRLIGIPLRKKAQTLSPNALMRNTVALGAAVQLFDMDFRMWRARSRTFGATRNRKSHSRICRPRSSGQVPWSRWADPFTWGSPTRTRRST